MTNGSADDFLTRLRSVLPSNWFPRVGNAITDQTGAPITDQTGDIITDGTPGPSLLAGLLTAWVTPFAFIYSLLAYIKLQTRIKTATGGWLDLIAYDFFGLRVRRLTGQSDDAFRATIFTEIFRPRNTRSAIVRALTDLTGYAPTFQNPWRDGAYLNETLYYNAQSLWGSRSLPFESFLIAYRGNGATDAQIYAAVESVRSEGFVLWVQIQNPA